MRKEEILSIQFLGFTHLLRHKKVTTPIGWQRNALHLVPRSWSKEGGMESGRIQNPPMLPLIFLLCGRFHWRHLRFEASDLKPQCNSRVVALNSSTSFNHFHNAIEIDDETVGWQGMLQQLAHPATFASTTAGACECSGHLWMDSWWGSGGMNSCEWLMYIILLLVIA